VVSVTEEIKIFINMNKSCFIKGIILLLILTILVSCRTEDRKTTGKKPNIVCIVTEDISPWLGCYGDSVAKTPVLDQLASDGVRFTSVFSVAGVCAPSRAALITGMYPSMIGANNMRTGNRNLPDGIPPYEAVPPPEVKCYTEFLRMAGYYCTNNSKEDYQFRAPKTAWDESSRNAHWRNRPGDQPFFAIFNIGTTHESQVWDRANDPVVIPPEKVNLPPYYPDHPVIRRDVARVYSNITVMDLEVGEFIDQLKGAGLYDETIIIFYSDHGGPLPRGKREIYDTGIKVPMIIRFPGNEHAGTVVDDLISFIDIPATILSLAGVKIPDYMHGQAFWGDQKAEPRDYIYAARDRMDYQYDCRRAVRDKQYKYIRNYFPDKPRMLPVKYRTNMALMQILLEYEEQGKLTGDQLHWFAKTKPEEELYDIIRDPYELNDLSGDEAYRDVLAKFRAVHKTWVEEFGDRPAIPEKELVWSMWPDGIQPVTAFPEIQQEGNIIHISCPTEGVSIGYQVRTGHQEERGPWFIYQDPLELNHSDTLVVIAHRIGFKPSDEVMYIQE
jgi:N-sulfoglucosamine sulfohydrolase